MPEPVIVTISHSLEKEEAVLRGLADGATSMDLLGFGED